MTGRKVAIAKILTPTYTKQFLTIGLKKLLYTADTLDISGRLCRHAYKSPDLTGLFMNMTLAFRLDKITNTCLLVSSASDLKLYINGCLISTQLQKENASQSGIHDNTTFKH